MTRDFVTLLCRSIDWTNLLLSLNASSRGKKTQQIRWENMQGVPRTELIVRIATSSCTQQVSAWFCKLQHMQEDRKSAHINHEQKMSNISKTASLLVCRQADVYWFAQEINEKTNKCQVFCLISCSLICAFADFFGTVKAEWLAANEVKCMQVQESQ